MTPTSAQVMLAQATISTPGMRSNQQQALVYGAQQIIAAALDTPGWTGASDGCPAYAVASGGAVLPVLQQELTLLREMFSLFHKGAIALVLDTSLDLSLRMPLAYLDSQLSMPPGEEHLFDTSHFPEDVRMAFVAYAHARGQKTQESVPESIPAAPADEILPLRPMQNDAAVPVKGIRFGLLRENQDAMSLQKFMSVVAEHLVTDHGAIYHYGTAAGVSDVRVTVAELLQPAPCRIPTWATHVICELDANFNRDQDTFPL